MKGVGTGLGDDIDHATRRATGFRSVAVRLDADFLDPLDVRANTAGSDHALIVIEAIDHEVVQGVVLAVDREAAGLATVVRAPSGGQTVPGSLIRSRHNLHQLHKITAIQWQILHSSRRDGRTDRRALRLQQGSLRFHADRFTRVTKLQVYVIPGPIARFDGEAGGVCSLKTA